MMIAKGFVVGSTDFLDCWAFVRPTDIASITRLPLEGEDVFTGHQAWKDWPGKLVAVGVGTLQPGTEIGGEPWEEGPMTGDVAIWAVVERL